MSRIVISYRREDSADVTGRIYDHLVRKFGREKVFKDVDAIPAGADFRHEIASAVGEAAVFLAVIGDRWLTVSDEEERRRIDDPNDFVRIEVEAALKRDIRLIPLLVRRASMPTEAELPETIRALAYRNAIPIREDPDFNRDVGRLLDSIAEVATDFQQPEVTDQASKKDANVVDFSHFMSSSIQEIEEQIKKRLWGQEHAIDQVMPWIKRLRFGLLRDDKPAGTFLFLGQSGVGKTLLAKELARVICSDEDRLVFFEMGQYRDPSVIHLLVGAPAGHVGYGEGQLVNALQASPRSVLFFDEIEKADTTVLDLVMRFIDTGFVQDAAGPVRDGRKAIVILATNARHVESAEGNKMDGISLIIEEMVTTARKTLPTELIARVDEIICFVPFSKAACREIVDVAIDRDILQLLTVQGIRVSVADDVRTFLAHEFYGMSPQQGARFAPRIVHRLLTLPVLDFALAEQSDTPTSRSGAVDAVLDKDNNVCIRAPRKQDS